MKDLLRRLGVEPARIEVLTDGAGPEQPAATLPTRSNVLLALQRLAVRAEPGSWAIVYLAGHGTQVPQALANRARYREPDGMDSVFLPRDASRWNAARREVEGSLSDDQIGLALRKIARRGVNIWAIFDTCHAGDMTRGPTPKAVATPVSVSRYLPAQELGVPPSTTVWRTVRTRSSKPVEDAAGGGATRAAGSTAAPGRAAWVAFYAAQRDEAAAEEIFADPMASSVSSRFGVFTYHLVQQAQALGPARNFSDLAQALQRAYRDRPFPTPYFEGSLHVAVPGVH